MKELITIQEHLKAPKSNTNKFGNYNYRSCEDIVEAVKQVIKDHKLDCYLNITDSIELIGDRYYVKAVASLCKGKDVISATAYARETQTKKGMDDAQVTGATSSYARKYALNGLFAIDDTKDADATNDHKDEPTQEVQKPTKEQILEIVALIKSTDTDEQKLLTSQGVKKVDDLNLTQWQFCMKVLHKKEGK